MSGMGERLFQILGLVDEDMIEEADGAYAVVKAARYRWSLAAAACLAVICLGGFYLMSGGVHMGTAGGEASESGSGSSHENGALSGDASAMFMSYSGPVFPLTTRETDVGITAARRIVWDFAPGTYRDGMPRQWGASVTDAYTLSNPSEKDVMATALYPFAGSFDALEKLRPTATVNGVETEAKLFAGPYSGTFGDENDRNGSTWNLNALDSWQEYRALLEDGAYLAQALEAYPVLDIPVVVYEFTDFTAPLEKYDAATQAVSFTIDADKSTVLCYGFNGMTWDGETGFRQYDYFVPDGKRRHTERKLLVVLGEDIGSYMLQGYENGACEKEIDGVACTVTRTESTLDNALEWACRDYAYRYTESLPTDIMNDFESIPWEMFKGAVAELITQYGILAEENGMDRYSGGRLDDLIDETRTMERVLYLAFPVAIPAGESVEVSMSLWKAPSFDFAGSGSENAGLQGYDLVTALGSGLDFRTQTAVLANTDGIEIVQQNIGFDLKNGMMETTLDIAKEHYYLEVQEK